MLNNEIDQWDLFQDEPDNVRNIILTYKTKPCNEINCKYNLNQCEFYHSAQDKRRKPFSNQGKIAYSSIMCEKGICCEKFTLCEFSHNSFEINFIQINTKRRNAIYACLLK